LAESPGDDAAQMGAGSHIDLAAPLFGEDRTSGPILMPEQWIAGDPGFWLSGNPLCLSVITLTTSGEFRPEIP
jgi:hypothetical protein